MQFEKNVIHRPAANKSNLHDGEKSLGHFIIKNLISAGDRTVIICGVTGRTMSAKELLNKSIEMAMALLASGINQGDVVAIISENRFEFVYVLFGILLINGTLAPLNHTYSERELVHAVNLSKPKFVFTSGPTTKSIVKISRELSYVKKIIYFDDCDDDSPSLDSSIVVVSFNDFMNETISKNVNFEAKPVNISTANCLIMCSSGTSGLPKGVQQSQFGIFAFLRDANESLFTRSNVGDGDITILGILPMFHMFGLVVLISTVATAAGKIILLPRFEEKTFLGCVEKFRCSVAFLVPPLFAFLAKNPYVDKYNLSSLRCIFCAAAPLSKELEQSVRDRLNIPHLKIKQLYAMTEIISALIQKDILKAGSVGDVNTNVFAKVIDESGNTLGPNMPGELCFKGAGMMMGYIGNEVATKATIDGDGWLHTGDVGYYDCDLQFFIVDRIKEIIKWKGFQVAPAEIEALLLTHPGIHDCGVIGRPDDLAGELPLAFVVKGDSSLTETEIVKFVHERSSPAKRLHGGVRFIDQIPKNPSGKILRRELRTLLAQDVNKSKL